MVKLKSTIILLILLTLLIACGKSGRDYGGTLPGDNTPPVANAGPDQRVITDLLITLDGSGSADADEDSLTYIWSFTSSPEGSTATLSDPSAVNPTFTADMEGPYVLQLMVNDGTADSIPDTVTVTADAATCKEDTTFGADGMVVFPGGFRNSVANDLAIQADGKILVTGYSETLDNAEDVIVARFNSDGSLDTSFGTDGIFLLDGYPGYDTGLGLVVQSDGKILVAGNSVHPVTEYDVILFRLNPDGTLDNTFGTDGVARWSNILDFFDFTIDIVLQPDDKILVTGDSNGELLLLRFNADGTLDTSFGTDGVVLKQIGTHSAGMSLALQQDGDILVAGYSANGNNRDFIIVRFNADGSLDTSFGTDGITTWDSGSFDTGYDLLLRPDGKILMTGDANGDAVLIRFNSDGSLDTSFGTSGIAYWDNSPWDAGLFLALTSDVRTIVSGTSNNGTDFDLLLLGFNADGSLDSTFGTDGAIIWDGGYGDDMGYHMTIDSEGTPLVAGYCYNGSDLDMILMKVE